MHSHSMNNHLEKLTVIIRSVGERTEKLCYELTLAQNVSPESIFVVRESPFSKAMQASFQIGLERECPWTFCIDADVLLQPGSIEKMLRIAEVQEKNVCEIQGYILDKFFGGPRTAGNHLYRTSHLEKVIKNIPTDGTDIRPEYYTLQTMKNQGYPWVVVPYLVGIHDFEQYYRDIFRKCFVQAHKHQAFTDLFLSIWRTGATHDLDYRMALTGFAKGIEYYDNVSINSKDKIYETYKLELAKWDIHEKEELLAHNFTPNQVKSIIDNWQEPEIYLKKFPTKLGLVNIAENHLHNKSKLKHQRVLQKLHKLGPIKILPYILGWLLQTIGQRIKKWCLKEN